MTADLMASGEGLAGPGGASSEPAFWVWDRTGPRSFERLWRFVDEQEVEPFATPGADGRKPLERLKAVLEALTEAEVAYRHELPFSPDGADRQPLRDARRVWRSKEATCLDMALVAAATCIRAGLHPWIALGASARTDPRPAAHAWLVVEVPDRGAYQTPHGDRSAVTDLGAWEAEVLAAGGAGPSEDGAALATAVARDPDRYRVVDVAQLCEGYVDPGFPEGPLIDDGTAMFARFPRRWACDVGWWWCPSMVLRPPRGGIDPATLLDPLWAPTSIDVDGPRGLAPSIGLRELFRADRQVVDFVDTDAYYSELVQPLAAWAGGLRTNPSRPAGLAQVRWTVAVGPGGAGKTRTLLELADELAGPNGSVTRLGVRGVLPRSAGPDVLTVLAGEPGTVVVVVDYAEALVARDPGFVEAMGRSLATRPAGWGPLLLLLSGREAGDWVSAFADQLGTPLAFVDLGGERVVAADPVELFARATTGYLAEFKSAGVVATPGGELLEGATALEVLLRAGLATAGALSPDATTRDLYVAALDHERNHWKYLVDAHSLGPWTAQVGRHLAELVALVSLLHPNRPALDAMVPDADLPAGFGDLLELLYGDPSTLDVVTDGERLLQGLQPDPLADHLIRDVLASPAGWDRLQAAVSAHGEWAQVFTTLDRAYRDEPLPAYLAPAVIELLTADDVAQHAVVGVAAAGGGTLRSAAESVGYLPRLALSLSNLGNRLSEVGRREEALGPTEEAVTIYRGLAAENVGYLPSLAGSLNNLGTRLSEVGRREEALAPTEEAVTIYRGLAAEGVGYLPDLALSLNSLGIRLSEVGRREEALGPTEEAVTAYRGLAAENVGYLPSLASSLNNLGIMLSEVGRREEALAPTEEAVTIRRGLAAESAGYLPDLAGSLINFGIVLSEVGRREEALGPTEEAVTIYRGLAAESVGYLPDLAGSLNNLGIRLSEVGRREEALGPTEEAVTTYRGLAAESVGYLPRLASSLNNLDIMLSTLGRAEEVGQWFDRAVAGLSGAGQAWLKGHRAAMRLGLGDRAVALSDLDDLARFQPCTDPEAQLVGDARRTAAPLAAELEVGAVDPRYLTVEPGLSQAIWAWLHALGSPEEADHIEDILEAHPVEAVIAALDRLDFQHPDLGIDAAQDRTFGRLLAEDRHIVLADIREEARRRALASSLLGAARADDLTGVLNLVAPLSDEAEQIASLFVGSHSMASDIVGAGLRCAQRGDLPVARSIATSAPSRVRYLTITAIRDGRLALSSDLGALRPDAWNEAEQAIIRRVDPGFTASADLADPDDSLSPPEAVIGPALIAAIEHAAVSHPPLLQLVEPAGPLS